MIEVELILTSGPTGSDSEKTSLGVFNFVELPRREETIAGVDGYPLLAVLGVAHQVNAGRISIMCGDPAALIETTGWEMPQ